MRDFFMDAYRIAKEHRDGEFGRWTLVLSSIVVVGITACRMVMTAWNWIRPKVVVTTDDETIEGA